MWKDRRSLLLHLLLTVVAGTGFLLWMQGQRTALQVVRNQNTVLVETVIQLEEAIGYMGMVHAFKNAVLRHDEPTYIVTARNEYRKALVLMDRLDTLSSQADLVQNTTTLRATLASYAANLDIVERMIAAGHSVEEIDTAVRIDDSAADAERRSMLNSFLAQLALSDRATDRQIGNLNLLFILMTLLIAVGTTAATIRELNATRLAREQARHVQNMAEAQTEAEQLKTAEMRHRLSNLIGIINAFNYQAVEQSDSVEAHADAVAHRLEALSVAHEVLFTNGSLKPSLDEIIHRLAAPYVPPIGAATLTLDGQVETMSEEATTSICLLLHELMTNAAKYGAFSKPGGKVAIQICYGSDRTRRMIWTESGGPLVSNPNHEGFGTRLIQGVVEQQLKGHARFAFIPAGLRVEIELPTTAFVAA